MDNTIEEAQKEGDTVITSTKLGKAASRHNLAGKNLQMFYLLQVSIIALEKITHRTIKLATLDKALAKGLLGGLEPTELTRMGMVHQGIYDLPRSP